MVSASGDAGTRGDRKKEGDRLPTARDGGSCGEGTLKARGPCDVARLRSLQGLSEAVYLIPGVFIGVDCAPNK